MKHLREDFRNVSDGDVWDVQGHLISAEWQDEDPDDSAVKVEVVSDHAVRFSVSDGNQHNGYLESCHSVENQ